MCAELLDFKVIGVHPVFPTDAILHQALELQWGQGLQGKELREAKQRVREHFQGLHLIEVRVLPADAEVDWSEITQPIPGRPNSDWQAVWDERLIDKSAGLWAFFLHYVDFDAPLLTPIGAQSLPKSTPMPVHLKQVGYELP